MNRRPEFRVHLHVSLLRQHLLHPFLEKIQRPVLAEQQHGVRREDGRDADRALATHRDLNAKLLDDVHVERRAA